MKTLEQIKKIGIAGSGVMGYGIAIVALQTGYSVVLYDISADANATALKQIDKFFQNSVEKNRLTAEKKEEYLQKISFTTDLNDLKADLIIEAVLENLEIKQKLFKELEKINDLDCILATNTSTIPVTQIAACLDKPEKFVGMHFFNPAPLMKLVEVISGAATSPEISQLIVDLSNKMGKSPVLVKDAPGFIVNRVARHYYLEALQILEENELQVTEIDALMENFGFKMGPFKLMDLIGIDTNHSVTQSLYHSFFQDAKFRPSKIQQKMVEAGFKGKKNGKGFYQYE